MIEIVHRSFSLLCLAMLLGVENVPAWAATRLENRICDFSPTASQCDVVCPADPESHPDNAVCRQAGTIRYAYDRNRKVDRFSGRGGILESVDNKTVLGNPIPAHAEASAPEVRWVLQRRYAYDATGVAMYLYCQGNPVNGIDPSGHDDLAELSMSSEINASLEAEEDVGAAVVSKAIKSSLFQVYLGVHIALIPHAAVFVNNTALNSGSLYDLYPNNPVPTLLGSYDARIRQQAYSFATFETIFPINFKVCKFNEPQYIGWRTTMQVLNSIDDNVSTWTSAQFSLLGADIFFRPPYNCSTWALKASAFAFIESKFGN